MKKKPNICLFDMDGTICDFASAMNAKLAELRSPFEPKVIDPKKRYRWMKARRSLIKATPGFWQNLAPLDAGFDLIQIANDLKYENHILTQGPKNSNNAWIEKKIWCDKYIPDLKVNMSQDKSLVHGNVLVDDWPPYFLPWLKAHPIGLVVAVAQPWNEDVSHNRLIRYTRENYAEVTERMTWALNEKEQ